MSFHTAFFIHAYRKKVIQVKVGKKEKIIPYILPVWFDNDSKAVR